MTDFRSLALPDLHDLLAPDGSEVRVLLGLERGGMAHFRLPAGQTSLAVTHRTVEEIWYIVTGRGEMWRKREGREEIVPLSPGVCLTIPLGTHFQFRTLGPEPLEAISVTMPPWPGEDEAIFVEGIWPTTTSLAP
jgi:mannose-6-phosphate isomerase-like protein (cupin superfamily)